MLEVLHDGRGDDTKTVLRQLEGILQDRNEYKHLLAQRGELAQSLLDLLQSLSNSSQASSQLRASILKAILRLSKQSNLYPQCLTVENIRQLGEHPVASGGFGEIWMGEVEGSEQVVCLKVVKLYLKSDIEKVLKNFLQEAIVWRQLDHPNLLPFLGLYYLTSSRQRLCLISPWMENGNLVQFLEQTPQSDVNHRQLVWDVANGLQYLHQMKIIHSDLKGVNILMTKSCRATIGDFGLSYVAEGEVLKLTSTSTFSGGTTRWLAPELLSSESRPSYKSDMYAFGCVCYEIYTGLPPFHNLLYDAAVLLQVMQGNRPSRPDNMPELSDEMWSLIEGCWATEPSSRPDIEEVRKSIDTFFGAIDPAPAWNYRIFEQIWSNAQSTETPSEAFAFLAESHKKLQIRGVREATAVDHLSRFPTAYSNCPESLLSWQTLSYVKERSDLDWATVVGAEAVSRLEQLERNRQKVIFHLIKSEMAFVSELHTIIYTYMDPIRDAIPVIISSDKLGSFMSTVFSNITELAFGHQQFLVTLHRLQREEYPVVQSIAAPLEKMICDLYAAYLSYSPNITLATYSVEVERGKNVAFRQFLEDRQKNLEELLNFPSIRLKEYEAILSDILSNTTRHHDDEVAIPKILDLLNRLKFDLIPAIRFSEQQLEARRLAPCIVFKPGEYLNLDLQNEHRILKHRGILFRKPQEGSQWSEWNELHVFLFDHYLVMTREKEKDGEINYLVQGRPIAIELLGLLEFDGPPVKRLASLSNRSSITADSERYFYPFSIRHAGRTRKTIFLFAESEDSRAEWKERLETMIFQRSIAQVFDLEPLNTETFWFQSISQSKIPIPSHGAMTGRIACSAVFHLGKRKVLAIGCFEGLWMGFAGGLLSSASYHHNSNATTNVSAGFRRVLPHKHVWQCAVIEGLGILLVLTEYTLFAYHAMLWPPGASLNQPRYRTRNISVQYFKLGYIGQDRLPVMIVMERKGLRNFFRILSPVVENIQSATADIDGETAEMDWFRTLGTFSTDEDSSGLDFIGGDTCAVFTKSGFEIVELSDPANPTIRTKLPKLGASLPASFIKRMEICHKIGAFRPSDNELLLCFDHFGIFTDLDGNLSRGSEASIIEWESKAEKVALHFPFILLFDTNFIEVRNIRTGGLAQIIMKDKVQCTSDDSVVLPDPSILTRRYPIHVVTHKFEPMSFGRPARVMQHLFEVVPRSGEGEPEPQLSKF
uniref:Uncharacterized protein n=1 Tax=Moniliophthora roreri TaxID=221103 RepID=A0A0W0FCY8_MONRR